MWHKSPYVQNQLIKSDLISVSNTVSSLYSTDQNALIKTIWRNRQLVIIVDFYLPENKYKVTQFRYGKKTTIFEDLGWGEPNPQTNLTPGYVTNLPGQEGTGNQ